MNLTEVFQDTLEISKKFFSKMQTSEYYPEHKMQVVFSNNTVNSIFEEEGRLAALNFADDKIPGGMVWYGANSQEESLCRSSNLYLSLVKHEDDFYREDGGLIYSKDIVFFKDSNYKLAKPKTCDIITCSSLVDVNRDNDEKVRITKQRMSMIVNSALFHGVDVLILGNWGCGAFGNDGKFFQELWKEVLSACGVRDNAWRWS